MRKEPLKLGFMASGRGSNLQSILSACKDGTLNAVPVVVISNNRDSGALQIASANHIPGAYLSPSTHPDPNQLDKEIAGTLTEYGVELLVLAGYMKKIGPNTLKVFHNRIINIHPSLLPAYGGAGMFGIKVHEAVLAAGEPLTGATVHRVNENYDEGRILAQTEVKVKDTDTPETLAARVLEQEHQLYVKALQDIIAGKINLDA